MRKCCCCISVHAGAFVLGDSAAGPKPSLGADSLAVYAAGGSTFFSDGAATTGVELAPGAGTWSSLSDRASKEDIELVDPLVVLERLAGVPVATWSYRAQGPAVRHMGPMAQDFHAAFGLGVSDTRIDGVDPDGVSFAAIQGLLLRLEASQAQVRDLEQRLAALEASLTED